MYYKIMFSMSLAIGTLIAISSYSWMSMWIGLEINLLSILPLMSSTKNMLASEAALKYFIAQTLASTLLLLSIILMSLKLTYNMNLTMYFSLIYNTSLLTKMGAAPFHFWFPEVMEGLNWSNSLIMLTWQKIAPMILLSYSVNNPIMLVMVIILSMLISGLMGINQTSLRKILAYSSINHIGWMIGSIIVNETIWMIYFITYSLITINIILIFKTLNIFYIPQLFISMNQNLMIKLFFILNFLSLGGLPPFLGFLPKWMAIQGLIQSNFHSIAFIMILMTLMTLYFYMQITFSTILLSKTYIRYRQVLKIKTNWILLFNFITITGLINMTFIFNYL